MTYEDSIKSEFDKMVKDPDNGIIYLDKLKENELLDLLVRLVNKAKRIKSRHWLRHGYLLSAGKVLQRLYNMNIHRWGLDEGKSGEDLNAFEEYFKDKLFGDFLDINRIIMIYKMIKEHRSEGKPHNNFS